MIEIDLSKLTFHALQIKNDLQSARDQIVRPILAQAAVLGYCSQDQFALRLGLEEAISNAYKHGNRCEPDRTLRVRWSMDPNVMVICIADDGEGFNPKNVPDPRVRENLEKPSGRGLMLIKAYMTELRFNERGNEICLIKVRKRRPCRTHT